jgi:primosomal protein N' (replication factor Y)
MYWEVALLSPPYKTYTYCLPEYFPVSLWDKGLRVCVPLNRNVRSGVLIHKVSQSHTPTKPLLWPLEFSPLLPALYIDLARELSLRQLKELGYILSSLLPQGLRVVNIEFQVQDDHIPKMKIPEIQGLSDAQKKRLARYWWAGKVILYSKSPQKRQQLCDLTQGPPWPLRPQARKQNQILEYLWTHGPKKKKVLRRELGSWIDQALRALVKKQLITWLDAHTVDDQPNSASLPSLSLDNVQLTREQEQAVALFIDKLSAPDGHVGLLYGITGSGKTMVYAFLIRECLEKGKSALIMSPELALAWNIWQYLQRYFHEYCCYLYHGYQSSAKRARIFQEIALQKSPCVVIGTRSAVLLPKMDWGLIVVDEEHDTSFKQEERINYQAKEIAYFINSHAKGLLLLGSATPDMKTYHSSQEGRILFFPMRQRFGKHHLPAIHLVDVSQETDWEGPFARRTHTELQQCLDRGEQAIILLNRRGYAPLVYCTSCLEVIKCPHCDVSLTYHKKLERLICHYCGHIQLFPCPCPVCGAHQFVPLREGTEQVEEYLQNHLQPNTEVLRLDRDSTRTQGCMEDILARFSSGQAQVMVGTQMCSKGHHFPYVTRVIVLDGDVGLNLPDYRATERTFQLLVQVAGRAGRGTQPGHVIIQTRNPDHYCWKYVVSSDFESFYAHEIEMRQRFQYPPFIKLALLRMSYSSDWAGGFAKVQEVSRAFRDKAEAYQVRLLGPAPAPIEKMHGRKRYQCLLKAREWSQIRSLSAAVFQKMGRIPGLRTSLDLDPVQML